MMLGAGAGGMMMGGGAACWTDSPRGRSSRSATRERMRRSSWGEGGVMEGGRGVG